MWHLQLIDDWSKNIGVVAKRGVKMAETSEVKRRGRPPKQIDGYQDAKVALIRAGLAIMTEKGFSASGLDEILRSVGVPKGSFYHYFKSKEDFGSTLIETYGEAFSAKLDKFLLDEAHSPLDRFYHLIENLRKYMVKHDFQRGCLIGNLGQEMGALPTIFRQQLIDVFESWQKKTTICFKEAQLQGEISADLDCAELARFFWVGWEGAILRAKLERNASALDNFTELFLRSLK